MKTLLLIAITIFFGTGAYAQANELNCTEQAFTFKINLPTGGRGYSSKIGQFNPTQLLSYFRLSGTYNGKQRQPETILSSNFEKASGHSDNYTSLNIILSKKMTFPYLKINNVTGKFTHTTYNHFKLLPMPVVNSSPFFN